MLPARVWLLALLVGCGGPAAGRDQGLIDAAPAADLTMAADLATTVGIRCGMNICATMAQFCCTSDNGLTGTCAQAPNGSCGAASEFHCDGPEDCPPAEPECCASSGLSMCRAVGVCAALGSPGYLMCHDSSTCAGLSCCPAPGGSPYALCLSPPCP
jgi:hypothetical protein